jgi:hypothetical protein
LETTARVTKPSCKGKARVTKLVRRCFGNNCKGHKTQLQEPDSGRAPAAPRMATCPAARVKQASPLTCDTVLCASTSNQIQEKNMFLPYQTQPGSGLSWYGVGKRIYPSNNTTLVDAGTATSSRHESVPRFCHPRCDILSVQQGAGGTRPREHYGALRPLATKKMWIRNAALHLQLQFVPSSEPTTTRAALCMRALQASRTSTQTATRQQPSSSCKHPSESH